jgi:protein phosphatase
MIDVPENGSIHVRSPSLLVLIGPSGAGKSTFARRLFGPFEIVSSDHCRAMIADSDMDQSVTPRAFELVRFIARLRLELGRLAVVDATNVQASARSRNLELALSLGVESVAIALDVPLEVCLMHNSLRERRVVDDAAVRAQRLDMDRTLSELDGEGFRVAYRLDARAMESVTLVRQASTPDARG